MRFPVSIAMPIGVVSSLVICVTFRRPVGPWDCLALHWKWPRNCPVYGDFWGHRGFTHSLAFAVLLAGVVIVLGFRQALPSVSRYYLWVYFFLATASHGLLDAMTDGGLGVAFFSPFDNRRYFLPWRPIRVSPIGFGRFFTSHGLAVMKSELLWVWVPAAAVMIAVWLIRQAVSLRATGSVR